MGEMNTITLSYKFALGKYETGDFIQFVGRSNETYKGCLEHRCVENKNIKHYSNASHPQSVFKLYEYYLGHLGITSGNFYRRPVKVQL